MSVGGYSGYTAFLLCHTGGHARYAGRQATPWWLEIFCPPPQDHLGRQRVSRQDLADWCKAVGGWDLEIVRHVPGTRGFAVQPDRWIVERTFGWLSRYRRMSKDYERRVQTSETQIEVAMTRLLVARHGRQT